MDNGKKVWRNESWLGGYISCGGDGFVYAISKHYVAKVPRNDDVSRLGRELEVHERLFRAGVQVPRPEGVFEVRLEGRIARLFKRKEVSLALVSQRIYGVEDYRRLRGRLFGEAERQFHEQLCKATQLGLSADEGDAAANTFFVKKERKLYLFDFANWIVI